MAPYIDPIIKKYIETIKTSNKLIKVFYQGDPIKVPMSSLPAIIISKAETRVGKLTNSEDEHGIRLNMTIITDIRNDLSDDAAIVAGVNSLYDIVEGRNANYTLKANCILNILRTNISLDIANSLRTDLDSVTRVDYGLVLGKRAPESWSIEASIDFVANFNQVR